MTLPYFLETVCQQPRSQAGASNPPADSQPYLAFHRGSGDPSCGPEACESLASGWSPPHLVHTRLFPCLCPRLVCLPLLLTTRVLLVRAHVPSLGNGLAHAAEPGALCYICDASLVPVQRESCEHQLLTPTVPDLGWPLTTVLAKSSSSFANLLPCHLSLL